MELEVDKKRLAEISDITEKRREEREAHFTDKKKEKGKKDKNFGNVLTASEKYKQMVNYNLDLD